MTTVTRVRRRAVGAAAVLALALAACGTTESGGGTAQELGSAGADGATGRVKTTSISPERTGRPPAALLKEYGVVLPEGATGVRYREVLPRSGGTLYVRMRVPDPNARNWLSALGGSPSDLTRGWSPFNSHELREAGWDIAVSDALSGAWIPVPESGPETDKKVAVVEDSSNSARVYLVTNR
ncbi:hypothetical protein LMJ38_33965 [Streptomyces sp. R1]|uniref:hypothetical protein n=1 Tax=Streptomyces TaxID=1883 RepID=UPI00052A409E|nr:MULTISPECIES: hypothetical protein [unclassified Streptomyces]AIV33683.1 hypothetical protein NI25_09405 [Streptomyces sp. CCM_MD2014]MCC8340908.1 hypothetical protein [Streptomyces sp. R1]MDA4889837.1 hypothetical protein [Streptomyces sp. MS2A]MYS50887.1 hypothetical protein [Streptomyces sp. SID6013]